MKILSPRKEEIYSSNDQSSLLPLLTDHILPDTQYWFRDGWSMTNMVLHWTSCRKNVRNKENHSSSPYLIRLSTWHRAGNIFMTYWKKSVVHVFFFQLVISFRGTWMHAFNLIVFHQSRSRLRSDVKQGCVQAPTLFTDYFAILLLLKGAKMEFHLKIRFKS